MKYVSCRLLIERNEKEMNVSVERDLVTRVNDFSRCFVLEVL